MNLHIYIYITVYLHYYILLSNLHFYTLYIYIAISYIYYIFGRGQNISRLARKEGTGRWGLAAARGTQHEARAFRDWLRLMLSMASVHRGLVGQLYMPGTHTANVGTEPRTRAPGSSSCPGRTDLSVKIGHRLSHDLDIVSHSHSLCFSFDFYFYFLFYFFIFLLCVDDGGDNRC